MRVLTIFIFASIFLISCKKKGLRYKSKNGNTSAKLSTDETWFHLDNCFFQSQLRWEQP